MNRTAVRQRTHQQRHLRVQLLKWPRPHSLKGSLCSFFKALSPGAVYSGTSSKFTFFFFIRLFFPFFHFPFVSFPSIFSFTNSFSFLFLDDEGSDHEPDGCEAEDAPTEAPSGAVFDVWEASSDDDTMHTAEPGYVTFEPDGSSVYTDAPSGLVVDMESDDDVSGDEPDGCEAEEAPAEASLGASVDAPPAAQPEGEAFAASSKQMHLRVLLWTWNLTRALATNQMAVRLRLHQQRRPWMQLLMYPWPHSLKGSLRSFIKARSRVPCAQGQAQNSLSFSL